MIILNIFTQEKVPFYYFKLLNINSTNEILGKTHITDGNIAGKEIFGCEEHRANNGEK